MRSERDIRRERERDRERGRERERERETWSHSLVIMCTHKCKTSMHEVDWARQVKM